MIFSLGSLAPKNITTPYYIFLFQQNNLLIKKLDEEYAVVTSDDVASYDSMLSNKFYIGSIDGVCCYTARFPEDIQIPDNMEFIGLRQLHGKIEKPFMQAAFRGVQIVVWDETHRYCGVCGTTTQKSATEHAKICAVCGHTSYPRLSPAVIVAVTKGDKILLGRNKNFIMEMYSVLAGFVEAGETLEECVKREIKEEAGIEVKNIKYFGSQSWPFPHSYMLGFTAEHESGEIKIDENELSDAKWFGADEMPNIPNTISISRKLIDWFIENASTLQNKSNPIDA